MKHSIKTIIYFAHPYKLYSTELERLLMNKISEVYPNSTIINPRDITIPEELKPKTFMARDAFIKIETKIMKKIFYPIIKRCDLLIFYNSLQWGVSEEITYARKMEKTIREIRQSEDSFCIVQER